VVAGYEKASSISTNDFGWRIMKFDKDDNSLWNYTVNISSDDDRPRKVVIDHEHNIIVAGYEKASSIAGDYGWRIMKFSSAGTSLWNYSFNASNNADQAMAVDIDSDNNITVVGYDKLRSSSDSEWRIMKFDKNGNSLWNYTDNMSSYNDEAWGVAIDTNNNIIVVGYDRSQGQYGSTGNQYDNQWRIMKFDKNGNSLWNYTVNIATGGTSSDPSHDIARGVDTDSFNNITVVGYDKLFDQSSGDFNTEWRIMKLGYDKHSLWNYTVNYSLYDDEAKSIVVDSMGDIIVTGFDSSPGKTSYEWNIMKFVTCDYNSTYCSAYGYTWFYGTITGNNGPCCGNDGIYDVFVNNTVSNLGAPCCIEGAVVASDSVSVDTLFKCYNGQIYSCDSDGTYNFDIDRFSATCDKVGSHWCRNVGWFPSNIDCSCNSGTDCTTGLCVQNGYCRQGCNSTYNKYQCSDDANNWNNDGICLNSTEGYQCVENVRNYCDFAIVNLTDTFNITRSNTYYCLNQSFSISNKNATQFLPSVQNSFLDCLGNNINGNGASNTYGVSLTGSNTKNNTIMNCSITNFYGGIFLYNGPNNNSFINNTIKSNTGYGSLFTGSNSNIITGGSIFGNTLFDYYLNNAGATNQFINTNFTSNRTIRFLDATSWFNYNNQTSLQLWLNTSVSSAANITRKIKSWNQTLIKWNDTNTSAPAPTVTYNITGLKPNKDYAVFNNSVLINTLHTDSSGNLPSFTVNLGSEHEIGVQEVGRWFDTNLTDPYSKTYTSSNPLPVYKNNEFNVIANATCRTDPPGLSGGCGSVSAGVRYNDTITTMTLVSTTIGASPMWTSGKIETDQYIYNYWNFSVGGEGLTQASGVAYNGTHFWVINRSSVNSESVIYRYNKTGYWDGWSIIAPSGQTVLEGIYVNSTHIGITNNGGATKYVTFFDITTGNYITSFSISSQLGTAVPTSLVFNATHVWVLSSGGSSTDRIYRYTSSGTYQAIEIDFETAPNSPCRDTSGGCSPDGLEWNATHWFIADIIDDKVYAFNSTQYYVNWNFSVNITIRSDPWGLDWEESEKNFYVVYLNRTFPYVQRYERNTSGAGNPISLGPMNDGDSNQVTFIVNATTPGDRRIDVNFTSDLGFENNTNDSYIRIKDAASEFLIINSTEIKPDPANPVEGGNATINVTVNITNSTYMDPVNGCSVRIFNSSMSYSNPTIGPLQGTIRRVNTQWQCNRTWYMEYWRNSGQWNVSVDLKLWMGVSNFTSKNFTYNSLYVWADNISTETISWIGVPNRTVNSSNAYPMLLNNTGNEKLNISINGSNFIGGSLIIGVGNSSFSNTTQTGPYYNISKTPQFMVTLGVREIKYVYFRAYIPLGFSSQTYNNNLNVTTKY
jgi:hypothetical protein